MEKLRCDLACFETGPIGHSGTSPGFATLAEVYGNNATLARPATGSLALRYVASFDYFRRYLPFFWNNSSQASINASLNSFDFLSSSSGLPQ